jgi:hypothetical protein
MPNVRAVVGSNTVKARVGSQNAVRVLSNASSPPANLIDLNDVDSTLKTEDGMLLVWDLPRQQFIMTSVIDSASSTIGGIVYYTNTTDNILGDPDTGSVQIDGGVGINKNLTVGGGFYVQGTSEFIGSATFRGGTIGIGDSITDDINIGGEFVSNLVPNDDATYDLGIEGQRWRNSYFSGIVSTTNLYVSGTSTFVNDLDLSGNLNIVGFVSVTEGLYYDSDSYEPNAIAYFNPDGQLSAASTTTTIDTSNYILTTYETAGIGTPVWATAIDGGEY